MHTGSRTCHRNIKFEMLTCFWLAFVRKQARTLHPWGEGSWSGAGRLSEEKEAVAPGGLEGDSKRGDGKGWALEQ